MGEDNAVLAVDTKRQEENFYPAEIRHLKEFEYLRIIWDDGHLSDYSLAYLRSCCPCPICKGRGDYSRIEREDLKLLIISAAEDSALNIGWVNGRHTSVYSFTFLRSLCSCRVCRAERMLGG